ncbi:MAG: ACP S-malonyltransferase [Clostridiales bacterium]|jgi:[acyl-carrier-protein] S-malonyltransferase|nr:ACP S-malonyltransferase [Clostridiales bacterium]
MGKIAFVFAGQGAQYAGMGRDLYEKYSAVRPIFDMLGERLKNLAFFGPADELSLTENTQPCLFAADLACAALLNEEGIYADTLAGFSLGEIPAVCHAGILELREAFGFVCFRAGAMQAAAAENPGAMLAVLRLPVEKVEEICARIDGAYPVNYNCPGQTVVACAVECVTSLCAAVLNYGGRAIRLPVSGPFHSPFMSGAGEKIRGYLQDKKPGKMRIPVYSNVTAQVYDNNPWELLARQVSSPVLWQGIIENMIADGVDTFVEVGPGRVLSGLISRINPDVSVLNVCDTCSLESTVVALRSRGKR